MPLTPPPPASPPQCRRGARRQLEAATWRTAARQGREAGGRGTVRDPAGSPDRSPRHCVAAGGKPEPDEPAVNTFLFVQLSGFPKSEGPGTQPVPNSVIVRHCDLVPLGRAGRPLSVLPASCRWAVLVSKAFKLFVVLAHHTHCVRAVTPPDAKWLQKLHATHILK